MLQIFAGPIEIPDTPETRRLFAIVAGIFIVMYIAVIFICSVVAGQLLKLFIRRILPKSRFSSMLNDPKGIKWFTLILFVVSTISTAVLFKTTWSTFDGIQSNTLGDSLFVLLCITVAILISSFLFLIGYKNASLKRS